jgi:hypothetical protein
MKIRFQALAIGAVVVWAVGSQWCSRGLQWTRWRRRPCLGALYAAPAELVGRARAGTGRDAVRRVRPGRAGRRAERGAPGAAGAHRSRAGSCPTRACWSVAGRGRLARAVDVVLNSDSMVRLSRGAVGWSGELQLVPTTVDTVVVAGRSSGAQPVLGHGATRRPGPAAPGTGGAGMAAGPHLRLGAQLRVGHAPGRLFPGGLRAGRPSGRHVPGRRVLVAEVVNQGRSIPAVLSTWTAMAVTTTGPTAGRCASPSTGTPSISRASPPTSRGSATTRSSSATGPTWAPISGPGTARRSRPRRTGPSRSPGGTAGTATYQDRSRERVRDPLRPPEPLRPRHARGTRVKQGQVIGYTGATGWPRRRTSTSSSATTAARGSADRPASRRAAGPDGADGGVPGGPGTGHVAGAVRYPSPRGARIDCGRPAVA